MASEINALWHISPARGQRLEVFHCPPKCASLRMSFLPSFVSVLVPSIHLRVCRHTVCVRYRYRSHDCLAGRDAPCVGWAPSLCVRPVCVRVCVRVCVCVRKRERDGRKYTHVMHRHAYLRGGLCVPAGLPAPFSVCV